MYVSLFGYGNTTKALAKHLKNAVFFDDKCIKPFVDKDKNLVKPAYEFDPDYSTLEIPSPGIAPDNPLIKKSKNLISEYDFFQDKIPFSIWISGTNGKTTTTQMLQHLLKDKNSIEGGNIGRALGDIPMDKDIWILESSSFTLHYTNKAKPNIYILLPINPDHISWHKTMQNYIDAKLKPITMMKEGEIAIVPSQYKDIKTDAYLIPYEDEKDLVDIFGFDTSLIKFKGTFLIDALLAMGVDKILFDRINYSQINSFVVEAHRQEEILDKQHRLWINDTKATNIDATISAIKTYHHRFIHLIVGGDDKGVELEQLFEYLQNSNLKLYTIGSNKQRLSTLAKKYTIEYKECKNLVDAIYSIDKVLTKDTIAMLSPAAASLDEFRSYAHRGDLFKETISQLS